MTPERKATIIAYLTTYIKLCQKYQMVIAGGIGAKAFLMDRTYYNSELHSSIHEIVYGLYDDDGNTPLPRSQQEEILSKLKTLLDNPNPPERPY